MPYPRSSLDLMRELLRLLDINEPDISLHPDNLPIGTSADQAPLGVEEEKDWHFMGARKQVIEHVQRGDGNAELI